MIQITGVDYRKSGVMILSKKTIESFVRRQLLDYKSDYFTSPHPIDIDDFVENYLRLKLEFHRLSLDGSDLGITTLSDGLIQIIDSDNKISIRFFKKGSIIIDDEACASENRTSFTIGHEAGHSQFCNNINPMLLNRLQIRDNSKQIESQYLNTKAKSDLEWMEWQADTYSAYLHMPKEFVVSLYKEKHNAFFKNKKLTSKRPKRLWKIVIEISEYLRVSREALAIRLKELKLISKKQFDSLNINKYRKDGGS